MTMRFVLAISTLAALSGSARGQNMQRRATFRGGSGDRGKCTIEVVVDGAAEVEIRGDVANLRNLTGQPPQWRRFECSGPMPANPVDFRFQGIDGRGSQQLIQDPRNGAAVVRIEDPKNGSEGYTFDITWAAGGGGDRYPNPGRPDFPGGYPPGNPNYGNNRRISVDDAVRICQDSIRQQARDRFRTPNVQFFRTKLDDSPGRNDWIVGTFGVAGGYNKEERYRFSCSVNFQNGRVRSAQIESREGDRYDVGPGYGAGPSNQALQNCQGAVEQKMRRDGYGRIDFDSIRVDDRSGGNDRIIGSVRAASRNGTQGFDFSCAVDLRDGNIRGVDVRLR